MSSASEFDDPPHPDQPPKWFLENQRLVRGVIGSFGIKHPDDEDVFQDVCRKAVQCAYLEYTYPAARSSWSRMAATHSSLDFLRKTGRSREATGVEIPDPGFDHQAEREEDERDLAKEEAAKAALARLTEEERRLLDLRYARRWKIGDIARLLGVERRALGRRLGGIRERLRRELEGP